MTSLRERPDPVFVPLTDDPRAALRRLPQEVTLATLRRGANAFMAGFTGPAVHSVDDARIEGPAGDIAIRIYRPNADSVLPVILFVHGGGFMLGSLATHDALCRSLAREAGAAVVALDYRLAPEAQFPAPLDDIAALHRHLLIHGQCLGLDMAKFALVGDSAGGQLAAAAAQALDPLHLGLFYPMVAPGLSSPSLTDFATGYMLTREFIEWAWEEYLPGDSDRLDPRLNLLEASPQSFPPATIVTAACDPLRDEGKALAQHLAEGGVDVRYASFAGMIHGFAGMPQLTGMAEVAIKLVGQRIAASLGGVPFAA